MMGDMPKGFNLLVTGTPGTGKTSLCAMLEEELGLKNLDVSKIVKDEHFYTEFDPAYDSYIIEEEDEDRLLDYLEPVMVRGGNVVDYHSSSLFPRRWFGGVVVMRADTDKLFDRLSARGYSEAKRTENLDAEIQGVCEEEARESYHKSCIMVRQSNDLGDMLSAVQAVAEMRAQWSPQKQEYLTFTELESEDGDDDDDDENDGEGGRGAADDGNGNAADVAAAAQQQQGQFNKLNQNQHNNNNNNNNNE